jgi:hypothetical protein
MTFEYFDERAITARERLLEYVIEVAGWLMRVDEQNQM